MVRTKIYLEEDTYEKVVSDAEKNGTNQSRVIRDILENHYHGKKPDRKTVNYEKLSDDLTETMRRVSVSNMTDRNAEDIINEILRLQKLVRKLRKIENEV